MVHERVYNPRMQISDFLFRTSFSKDAGDDVEKWSFLTASLSLGTQLACGQFKNILYSSLESYAMRTDNYVYTKNQFP